MHLWSHFLLRAFHLRIGPTLFYFWLAHEVDTPGIILIMMCFIPSVFSCSVPFVPSSCMYACLQTLRYVFDDFRGHFISSFKGAVRFQW